MYSNIRYSLTQGVMGDIKSEYLYMVSKVTRHTCTE